jgi:hypothetical protein
MTMRQRKHFLRHQVVVEDDVSGFQQTQRTQR